MNEGEKILKDIFALLLLFFMGFFIFAGFFAAIVINLSGMTSAYNQCHGVEDDKFTACYESKQ